MNRTCRECKEVQSVTVKPVLCRVRLTVRNKRRAYFQARAKAFSGGRAWHGRVCPDCKLDANKKRAG